MASMLIVLMVSAITCVGFAYAQDTQASATVQSLQGTAQVSAGEEPNAQELRNGSAVNVWDTVSTDEKSKLLLKWENGLLGSLGEFSSLSLASEEVEGRQVPDIEIINGIFRFATQQNRLSSYLVTTPLATILPANDQPVDFTVEVYSPETALITVMAGEARVKKSSGEEIVVPSCHNLFIEQGKASADALAVPPEDLKRLVEETTIPGTIVADLRECSTPVTAEVSPPQVEAPSVAVYSEVPDYYVEDWDTDMYPYVEVSVLPPAYAGAGYICVIPGIGRFVIDIPFVVEPAVIDVYCRHVFLERGIFFYRDYLAGVRLRERELAGLVSLARMTGNVNLLRQAERSLDELRVRTNWASRRMNRLEQRASVLQQEQRNLSARLPRGADLHNIISGSLNSPANLAVARKFQNRLRTDEEVQSTLANLAGQEIGGLRERIAKEPNLSKRLALKQELSRLRGEVANGKAIIPKNQQQVDSLVRNLGKTSDPERRADAENRLVGQLQRRSAGTADLLSQERLASLKQDLNKFPNPQGRAVLEKRVAELEQSVGARRQAESNTQQTEKKIEDLTNRVSGERNAEKRNELLGQLNELSRSLTSNRPGGLQFLEQQKLGKPPAVQMEPRTGTQGSQDILKRDERQRLEQARQQQLERQQQTEKRQQELLQQQTRQRELQQLERQKQLDLKRQQELQQARQQQLQQQELQKQQLERQRQSELKRQQELQQQKMLEQQRQQQVRQQQMLQQQQQQQYQQQLQQQRRVVPSPPPPVHHAPEEKKPKP
ncbi:MAG TPA: hypothetical protein VMC85_21980 [Desulfomonilaceae bacterium]|nr:hypothetical protein [Desulfomonilaceae bacterium]